MTSRHACSWLAVAALLLALDVSWSQPAPPPVPTIATIAPSAPASWTWAIDANAFGGYNYQRREFTDFDAWNHRTG